jgi:hypothetical protein
VLITSSEGGGKISTKEKKKKNLIHKRQCQAANSGNAQSVSPKERMKHQRL